MEDDGNALGLTESEMDESLKNLQFMADQASCDMCVRQLYSAERGLVAEVVMTRRERLTVDTIHLTVAVAGELDAGKSTTIGVLSSGLLDNGKGLARTRIFLHNHEIETGRTSCVSHTVLHFDKDGEVLNSEGTFGDSSAKKHHRVRALSDLELADETNRSVTLIDLAGHPKYLKTTVHGMLGRRPDYCLVCISLTAGIQAMTFEHIGLGLSLNVPLVIVITKVDALQVPLSQVAAHPKTIDLLTAIRALFPSETNRSFPIIDSKHRLIDLLSPSFGSNGGEGGGGNSFLSPTSPSSSSAGEVVPIFFISNLTGEGLILLKNLLYQLPDLKKATGQIEMTSPSPSPVNSLGEGEGEGGGSAERECDGSEVWLRSGNYIRVLGSIGSIGGGGGSSDEDNLDFDEEEEDGEAALEYGTVLEAQLQRIQEELCGLVFSPEGEEEVEEVREVEAETPRSTVSAEEATENYLRYHDQILRYKSALVELSSFVDLRPLSTSSSSSSAKRGGSGGGRGGSKILIGKVISGKLQVMDELFLGPSLQGDFVPVRIASIRLNNVPVRYATAGQTATFRLVRVSQRALRDLQPLLISSQITSFTSPSSLLTVSQKRRNNSSGLVLMSSQLQPQACLEFEAEISVVNHPSKIRVNYEPVIHVGAVKQTGKILSITHKKTAPQREAERGEGGVVVEGEVGNGETAMMRFRFLYQPELITIGETIILREDRMKGRGVIRKILR